jgi:hypothetical protein
LLKLGEKPLASMDENSAGGTLARTLFASASRSLLDSYRWNFAKDAEPPVENWPEYFAGALSLKLAAELCMPLCDNPSLMRAVQELARDELKNAKLTDMRDSAPLEGFSLIDQRF